MDVELSEEQTLLQESARSFLASECPMALVREQMESRDGLPPTLWKKLAELGWLGLLVGERHGGSGLSILEVAVVLEEMGRVLLPAPFLSTAVLGALALELGGSEAQKSVLLPRLVSGELRIALAQLEEDPTWAASGIHLGGEPTPDGYRLQGRKLFCQDGPSAHQLLVPVRTAGSEDSPETGVTLLLVDAASEGLVLRPIAYNEQTHKLCEVTFDGVEVPRSQRLGDEGGAWPLLADLLAHAKVALCAEMAGSARRVLELSVAYAQQREQFGQPIGRFQAIQHKCADMLVRAEGIKSAAYYAAWSLATRQADAHTAACLAKAYCAETFTAVASDGIQIHGGLGFTWEQDLHLYFKRAKAAETLFGDATWNRELAARELIDAAPLAGLPT